MPLSNFTARLAAGVLAFGLMIPAAYADFYAPGGSGPHVCKCLKWGYCTATGSTVTAPHKVPCCIEKQCH
jgi:hypothetical protein